ncbi:MAG: rhodanese-like domain-containing protein [Halobacteriovoraceae bacterium]|nr:rhodanese-like domain-containing protein [Halobacteriovoraceae bacterium]
MPIKFDDSIFKDINALKTIVFEMQARIHELEKQVTENAKRDRFQLLRIKNNEELSDDFILKSQAYLDLSPEKAFRLYQKNDLDFIFLDVSTNTFSPTSEIPEITKIPLEELQLNQHKLPGKSKSIFIISENGIRSIRACKVLNKLGFYNLNNISGGYQFWPGFNELPKNTPLQLAKEA